MLLLGACFAVAMCLWSGSTNGLLAILIFVVMDMSLTIYSVKSTLAGVIQSINGLTGALMDSGDDAGAISAEEWGHISAAVKPALTPIIFTQES